MTIFESDNVIFDLKPTAIKTIDSVDYYKYTHTIEVKPSDAETSPSFVYNKGIFDSKQFRIPHYEFRIPNLLYII